MIYYTLKVFLSAILIVAISEIAKKNLFAGAVIASLPIISILAFLWMYFDTGDAQKIAELSKQIFWLVIPSLLMFLALPVFIKNNINFYLGLVLSIALTSCAYLALVWVLKNK